MTRKIVIQETDDNEQHFNDSKTEFEIFTKLVEQLEEIFGIHNSKHNTIGYINGLCSEYERYEIQEEMRKSLENPKNDMGD